MVSRSIFDFATELAGELVEFPVIGSTLCSAEKPLLLNKLHSIITHP